MTTTAATRKFRCPKCGHKHAADLSPMEGHPGMHGKVPCTECHTLMWISLSEDGSAKAELYEAHLHDVYEKKAEEAVKAATEDVIAAAAAAPRAASTGWIGPVIAAAVVAAVVSFAIGSSRGSEQADAGPAAADPTLAREVQSLSAALATSDAARGDMARQLASLQEAVARHGEALARAAAKPSEAAPDPQLGALKQQLEQALARYAELNGRIEGNYTNLRIALQRLKALEGE